MSIVHIAHGSTFKHKRTLSQMKFKFHYADKVWVRFTNPSLNAQELADDLSTTQAAVEELDGVGYDNAPIEYYTGTSVDPYVPFYDKDSKTGYKVPKIEKLIDQSQFEYQPGDRIEIKTWLAKRLQESFGEDIFFRNLEIVETVKESQKAVLCSFKFISDIAESCHKCGRSLDDPISVATGIGPVCLKSWGIKRASLADSKRVLAEINKIAETIGTLGPHNAQGEAIWIAKSQIKKRLEKKIEEKALTQEDIDRAEFEEEWKRQKEKFAKYEAEQEAKAFKAKMNREGA